jgi:hypothetical protein
LKASPPGPSFDGLSDTLYAVTNQTDADEPDYNVRWVECLMPQFDAGQAECDAFHVDGGAVPCCAILLGTSPTFTGVRIYGLWHLNGKTIQPFIGGLDLGDYTVANGYIDITFGDSSKGHDAALFTLAFFSGLADLRSVRRGWLWHGLGDCDPALCRFASWRWWVQRRCHL